MGKAPAPKPRSKESSRQVDDLNKIILDNVPVSVITIDKEGNITSANKYFKNFSEGKTHKHTNIFSSEFFVRENLVDDYRRLLSHGTVVRRDDCHEINSKGEDKYLNIIAVPFKNEKGEIEGAISLASDNTEAAMAKKELVELNGQLEKRVEQRTKELSRANEELSRVLELKSIFTSDVSHEIRTSLTIMRCSLDLLSRTYCTAQENAPLIANITAEIKRSSDMLSDLGLLTKSHGSELKLKREKMNLTSFLASICNQLEVIAHEKKVTITCSGNASPVEILADREGIEKVLLNLIRNAIKYNRDGGWVKAWVEAREEGAYLKVEDNGIGIPEKEIPHIFERFYRVDKARTRNGNGEDSGLGLAICKHVAEAHGGMIEVASTLGEGSLFTVFLPYPKT
ncbi:MAG: PAS domain-containing sensor histidine kinase [Candidatus Paceibacterota bacterium]|jgi:signal transduction histidine kinase